MLELKELFRQFFFDKKRLFGLVMLILLIIGGFFATWLVSQRLGRQAIKTASNQGFASDLKNEAAPASRIYFDPNIISIAPNQSSSLDLKINPTTNTVTAVEVHFSFEPDKIQLKKITPSADFPTVLQQPQIDNALGQASITLGIEPNKTIAQTTSIATIDISTKDNVGSTILNLTNQTKATAIGENESVIVSLGPTTIQIAQATSAPTQPASITPPNSSVLSFPTDHSEHRSFKSEWWYLNLAVGAKSATDLENRDLGYVISFSRINNVNGLLSSRYFNTWPSSFTQNTDVNGQLAVNLLSGSQLLKIDYTHNSDNSLAFEEITPAANGAKRYHLKGQTPQIGSVDLTLQERTVNPSGSNTPLLWGCTGKISVFQENDTFYYSIPDLDISGTIIDLDGKTLQVQIGKAWLDHQWFNSSPSASWKGHYWMSFHYTSNQPSGTSPMTALIIGPHPAIGFVTQIFETGMRYTYWVKRTETGQNECGESGSININQYADNGYPLKWDINLKKEGTIPFASIKAQTYSSNQIITTPLNGLQFLEAASYLTGNIDNNKIVGVGFFETHLKQATTPTSSPTPTTASLPSPTPTIFPTLTPVPYSNLTIRFTLQGINQKRKNLTTAIFITDDRNNILKDAIIECSSDADGVYQATINDLSLKNVSIKIKPSGFLAQRTSSVQLTSGSQTVHLTQNSFLGSNPLWGGDLAKDDNKVDIYDFNRFVEDFGPRMPTQGSIADLNLDGVVDIYDFNELVNSFGKTGDN